MAFLAQKEVSYGWLNPCDYGRWICITFRMEHLLGKMGQFLAGRGAVRLVRVWFGLQGLLFFQAPQYQGLYSEIV